jgi:hypothetical protein
MGSMAGKRCSKCKKVLPFSEFHKAKDRPDGHKYWCKKCVSIASKLRSKREYHRRRKANICTKCNKPALQNLHSCLKHYFYDTSYNHFGTSKYWKELMDIAGKQDYICPYSGLQLIPGVNMSLDHKRPVSRFPKQKTDLNNVQFCDMTVNQAKHAMTEDEFLAFIERIYYYSFQKSKARSLRLNMPLCDVCDRLTILMLKVQRLPEDNAVAELLSLYQATLEAWLHDKSKKFQTTINELVQELYEANSRTWDLEYAIRVGILTEKHDLNEIGSRAVQIRESNKKRITIKNALTKLAGELHGLDRKVDHGSEEV